MDTNGVDRAVVLAFDAPEAYPVRAPSEWVLDEVDSYPDRLVPFCTVDPRDVDETDAADRLEHYIGRGARGFGELKMEMDIDDDRLELLYELCATYELPILFTPTDRCCGTRSASPTRERTGVVSRGRFRRTRSRLVVAYVRGRRGA